MKEKKDGVFIRNPYFLLISVSLITGLILYYPFIFGDKILAYAGWGYDTRHSYLPAYEFWHNRIAQGRFSMFDFTYGWGTNVFAVIWALMDPFSGFPILVSLIAGVNFIGKTLALFQILKSVCISVVGFKYFRLMGYSLKSAFIPSYIMGYCGYMIVTGEHYFFSTYAVFFAMILLFAELSMQQAKMHKGLYICIAWLAAISVYAVFQAALAVGIYVLIRSSMLSKDSNEYILRVYQVIKGAIIGMLLSLFSVLPQIYAILVDSSRVNTKRGLAETILGAFKLLPKGFILETVSNFFSSNLYGTINEYHGYGSSRFSTTPYFFGMLFTFSAVHFAIKLIRQDGSKKERFIKISAFCIGFLVLFSQFFIQLSNLFVYLQWRFVFALLPFFGMVCADFLEDLFHNKQIRAATFMIPAVTVILILWNCDKNIRFIRIAAYLAVVCICILELIFFMRRYLKSRHHVLFLLLLALTAVNLLADSGIVVYADQSIMEKYQLENGYRDSRITSMLQEVEEQEGANFYRIDRTYVDGITPDILFSFVQPMRTLSVYNSTLSTNLVSAVTCLADTSFYTQMGYSIGSIGMKFDSDLADLFGLKYVISHMRRDLPGWEEVKEVDGLFLYRNTRMNGAGVLYSQSMPESAYEKLTDVEKCFLANQYLIVDSDRKNNETDIGNLAYQDVSDRILEINETEDSEVLYLSSSAENAGSLCLEITMDEVSRQSANLSFYNQDGMETDTKMCQPGTGSGNIVSKVPLDTAYIKITLDDKNRTPDGYRLYECTQKGYTNSGVHLTNEGMGNVVSGWIDAQKDSYLLLPIPYEDCWELKINGETAEYRKADYGLIAVEMDAGTSLLTMKYDNKFNKAGSTVSMTVFAVLILMHGRAVFRKRRKNAR